MTKASGISWPRRSWQQPEVGRALPPCLSHNRSTAPWEPCWRIQPNNTTTSARGSGALRQKTDPRGPHAVSV